VELDVYVAEGLQTGAKSARGAAYALGHGSHPTIAAGQEGHDAIGLAQLVDAQNYCFVAIHRHEPIVDP
jgi:hypothetical protein